MRGGRRRGGEEERGRGGERERRFDQVTIVLHPVSGGGLF
jgi:hypothetical protein